MAATTARTRSGDVSNGCGAGGAAGTGGGGACTTGVTGRAAGGGAAGSEAGSVISSVSTTRAAAASGLLGGTTGVRMVSSAAGPAALGWATNLTPQLGHLTVLPSRWSCTRNFRRQLVHWMRIAMAAQR